MALGETEPVDLTLDDDEESLPPSKRAKMDKSSDSDVEVVCEPRAAPCSSSAAPQEHLLGDNEDIIVTKHTGQVWNEHLPHQRYQCGLHPFRTSTTRQNAKHCDQCFCFICDVSAASCMAWGNGAQSKHHCNAHAGSALFRDMRDVRLMRACADTPAQTANQSHHIHPSSSARAQPTARPTMLSDLGRAAAAHLFRNSAQADITQLPRSAAAAHPATASATASARAARCTLAAGAAEAAPASAASMGTPTVPARQPAGPCTQRLDLSEIRSDAHSDQDMQQQAARLGQHTAELDDEWEADVGPPATAASQAVRSASVAQAPALPHPLTPAASASAPSASNQDASTTTAESSQPAGSDDSALPPPGPGQGTGQPTAAAGKRMSTPSAADAAEAPASRPATIGSPPEGPAAGAAAPAAEPAAPAPPELLPLPPHLLQPDPMTLGNLVQVGMLQFPFKVKAPYTMADLTKRLVPNGVYVSESPKDSEPNRARSSRLHINSFKKEQRFIQLQPLPDPYADSRPLPERIFPVTVISSDGRDRPTMFGMPIKQGATYKEVAEAASQQDFATCSNSEEMLLFHCSSYSKGPRNVGLANCQTELLQHLKAEDEQHLRGYVLMRVPKLKQPEERTIPAWVLIQSKSDEDGDLDQFNKIAYDILLPLPKEFLQGGQIAAESIGLQLLQAVRPYRKAGAPPRAPHECFSLMRCFAQGAYIDGDQADFRRPEDSSLETGPEVHLVANWHPAGLALFDTEAWGDPEVHASAAMEVLSGTQERLVMDGLKQKYEREWAGKAESALLELARICDSNRPTDLREMQRQQKFGQIPSGQCKLAILPGDSAEEGTLQVEVYLSRIRVRTRSKTLVFVTLFDSAERRYSLEHGRWYRGSAPDFALEHTMELLLGNNLQAKAMYKEMREWAQRVKGKRLGVTTLMEMLQAGERPVAPQPQGLTVELRPFQRQALRFMLDNERKRGGHRDHFWVPVLTADGEHFWYSPLHRRAVWKVPAAPCGGFLAEEMGCGKTIEMLALILSNPAPIKASAKTSTAEGLIKSRATLVICAVSLVGQWLEEAKSKLDGSLKLYMYHGSSRKRNSHYLATSFDLVVTTYQTLGSDWRAAKAGNKKEPVASTLHGIQWHRIILDESHTIKAGGANQALACCSLQSARRWCCSGTPISTEIKDFAGQFAFLRAEPFGDKSYFNNFVNASWQSPRAYKIHEVCNGTNALLFTLGRMLMRHTKAQTIGGQAVSQLPPKTEENLAVCFGEAEAERYMQVHQEAKQKFQGFLRCGAEHINRHLLLIMSLLGPLRRCCSGGALRKRELVVPDGTALRRTAKAKASAKESQGADTAQDESLVAPLEECSVCLNGFERPTMTPCAHWFCRECILAMAEEGASCPLCREAITIEVLREVVLPVAEHAADAAAIAEQEAAVQDQTGPATWGNFGDYPGGHDEPRVLFESKLNALLNELAAMRARDPAAKALIFTQFSGTLAWLARRLQQEGYGYRTISGSMPLKKRAQAIEAFQKDPPTTVFLLSMRSGAVGINLTAANHVFLMEPAFNPALEAQAIGRAHRMGQTRPVVVKKFYIKGSVEECIMEIIEQRKKGRQQGSSANEGIDEEGQWARRRKRAQQDVAGSLKADRQNLRTAELELLFQAPAFAQAPALTAPAAAYDTAPAPASRGAGR